MTDQTLTSLLSIVALCFATIGAVEISCPRITQSPTEVQSNYYNLWLVKFRTMSVQCRDVFVNESAMACSWSDVRRELTDHYQYSCPTNVVLSGIRGGLLSGFSRYWYQVRCCSQTDVQLSNCTTTEFLNNYRQDIVYTLSTNHAIRGFSVAYSGYWRDRQLQLDICEISGAGVIRNK